MKHLHLFFAGLFSISITLAQANKSDSTDAELNLRSSALKMGQFFVDKNYTEYLKFINPKMIKLVGGGDKMTQVFANSVKQIESQGLLITAASIGKATKIISANNELQAIVTQLLALKNKDGNLITTS